MSVDAIESRYNILRSDQYRTFEYQIPAEQFIELLEEGETPDKMCVIHLGQIFKEGRERRLSQAMQDRASDLDHADVTIQFSIEGSIQSVLTGFELLYQGELYRLDKVFGADLSEYQDGWLIARF